MRLDTNELIRRFLMHVLPHGFHRIRYYGLLTSPTRANNIARIRELLAVPHLPIDTISRPPPQSPKSRNRQTIPAHAAAAACASSRPSCRGNSPSTARRRFRPRSGSTPHDEISQPAPKSRSPVCSLPSRPRLSSHPCCLHHPTAPPVFTATSARTSKEGIAPDLFPHPHGSTGPRG
jgi:hypothetical protein